MPPVFQHIITLLARVMLSLIFVLSGVNHLLHWNATVERMTAEGMASEEILGPAGTPVAHVLLGLGVACLLLGGLSVLLGVRARWGAVVLFVFLVTATLIFHDYWRLPAGSPEYFNQMHHLLKNVALAGGLLTVLGFGSGGFSLDMLLPRRRKKDVR
jgi:putative oxidoreductase